MPDLLNQSKPWAAKSADAHAEVAEWDEFRQGYNTKGECVVCICGVPYPMRREHYCPADKEADDV